MFRLQIVEMNSSRICFLNTGKRLLTNKMNLAAIKHKADSTLNLVSIPQELRMTFLTKLIIPRNFKD